MMKEKYVTFSTTHNQQHEANRKSTWDYGRPFWCV